MLGQNDKMGSILTIQRQMIKIPLQSPGKMSIFQFLPYFSTCPSLKSGTPTPIKILFFEFIKDRSISLQISEIKNCIIRKHLKLGVF